ncbi:hypothetical protein [Caproicibacter sp.]|uniref:hypothetical protein n=1 Tax=Caproicibacter sp. TaxID=2814884 RepID=UPI00398A226B
MNQPLSRGFSEIFLNNLFELDSYACECEKDIKNVAPGEPPETTLKLYSNTEQPLHYSYAAKEGLNLTGNNGGVLAKNILGQLLALKDGDVKGYVRFIKKYGFMLPVAFDSYEAVQMDNLVEIIKRIKATVTLMNTVDSKSDYEEMFNAVTFLLYRKPVVLKMSSGEYTTFVHGYTENVYGTPFLRDFHGDYNYLIDQGFFTVSDVTVSSGTTKISSDLYLDVAQGENNGVPGKSSQNYRNLFAMYIHEAKSECDYQQIIDFYEHYQMDYPGKKRIIDFVDLNKITYYNPDASFSLSDDLKKVLPVVARMVLSQEMNHNIVGIHLQYDGAGLAPKWKVETLLQALYFSVFYMKPGVEIYKRCKNPNCRREVFFLTNRTKTNKEYCCDQCRSAAAAQRSRQKKNE